MLGGFVAGVCADYWFGWLSYASADRSSRARQRTLVVALGGLVSLVLLLKTGDAARALIPLAGAGAVLAMREIATWIRARAFLAEAERRAEPDLMEQRPDNYS